MARLESWGQAGDTLVSQAVVAMDGLAWEYMVCFGVGHVTPHIMKCLMEVVCPEAVSDAKDAAIEEMKAPCLSTQPKRAVHLLRTLFSASGVSVRDVVSRCAAERRGLALQMALCPPHIPLRSEVLRQVNNVEAEGVRAVKDVRESRALLDVLARRIQALEPELHEFQPQCGLGDEMGSLRLGEVVDATVVVNAKSTALAEGGGNGTVGGANLVTATDNASSTCGYVPSIDFVLPATQQLSAESYASCAIEVNGGRRDEKQKQRSSHEKMHVKGGAQLGGMTPANRTAHGAPPFSGFSLTSLRSFPFQVVGEHVGREFCDVLPPTTEAISAQALSALMADKRPLRVQHEERMTQEKEWNLLGMSRLACAEMPTGPSAYTRQAGVRHLLRLEQQISRMTWL
ncbi:hypothetical protein TraAM80_04907 [Trypanosoma rangeli]|uniref:Uncharacterized protein n=1 Tax=Trypanosoma rangeli TaxID=5698 RepID=A0A3R7NDD8_TRYRA|nr:uncharacterized protein TraAM80_04907 [Trypanosoma rangeli]RNF04782.1 hypothetical protein TraAM80_04907 [Trypanosoma rangeli]|eukprot:RNF04782.1 hypothetical protein TraAM80_04907 [Trypanosoma rangeli]